MSKEIDELRDMVNILHESVSKARLEVADMRQDLDWCIKALTCEKCGRTGKKPFEIISQHTGRVLSVEKVTCDCRRREG